MTRDRGPRTNRWLHYLSVLTVCAALPLLLLGAEVTTKDVGMVDPQGFRPPWHMLTVQLRERGLGFIIEHSHRLAGFIVGSCMIGLAVGLWLREPRRWVRWLGVAGLAGVSLQGLLGYLRVRFNASAGPEIAFIHGCFAPLVFAVLVSLPLVTSRRWLAAVSESPRSRESANLRTWSLLTAAAVYLQIVFGALVRRTEVFLGPRLHLLFAFVIVAAVVGLVQMTLGRRTENRPGGVMLLAALVVVQLLLGMESWLGKFTASAEWPQLRPMTSNPELFRSLHYLVGSLIFAAAAAITLQVHLLPGTSKRMLPEGTPEKDPETSEIPAPALDHSPLTTTGGCMKSATTVYPAALPLARSRALDYLELTKPRVAVLVLFTVAAGTLLASGGRPDVALLIHTLAGTALVAAGASALNQLLERHTDALMRRTENRPLPAGRMGPLEVFLFGSLLVLIGLVYLAFFVHQWLTVLLAGLTFASYVFLYTPLKRKTALNTLVGAVPGALPPVIGWTAVTGSINAEGVTLFLILFLWQVPHFLAIAWIYRDDYGRAGLRMLPVVDEGGMTGRQMVSYCLALIPASLAPALLRMAGPLYVVVALLLGLGFLACAIAFQRKNAQRQARRLLRVSLLYLPALLAMLLLSVARSP